MTKKRWVVIVTLMLVGGAAVLVFAYLQRKRVEVQPITLRYVQTGQFSNGGHITFGTTFWATNHTSATQAVLLSSIEVKIGTNWVIQGQSSRQLAFQAPDEPWAHTLLNPHGVGYATLQLSNPPAGTTWRLRVMVQKRLTGIGDAWVRITKYPGILARERRWGNTNISMNPFAKGVSFFGPPIEVTSQEISEE